MLTSTCWENTAFLKLYLWPPDDRWLTWGYCFILGLIYIKKKKKGIKPTKAWYVPRSKNSLVWITWNKHFPQNYLVKKDPNIAHLSQTNWTQNSSSFTKGFIPVCALEVSTHISCLLDQIWLEISDVIRCAICMLNRFSVNNKSFLTQIVMTVFLGALPRHTWFKWAGRYQTAEHELISWNGQNMQKTKTHCSG